MYFWNALLLGTQLLYFIVDFITIHLDHSLNLKYPKTTKMNNWISGKITTCL